MKIAIKARNGIMVSLRPYIVRLGLFVVGVFSAGLSSSSTLGLSPTDRTSPTYYTQKFTPRLITSNLQINRNTLLLTPINWLPLPGSRKAYQPHYAPPVALPDDLAEDVPYPGGFFDKLSLLFSSERALRTAIEEYKTGNKESAVKAWKNISLDNSSTGREAKLWLAWSDFMNKDFTASEPLWSELEKAPEPTIVEQALYFGTWQDFLLKKPIGEALEKYISHNPNVSAKLVFLAFWISLQQNNSENILSYGRWIENAYPYTLFYANFLELWADYLSQRQDFTEALRRYDFIVQNFQHYSGLPRIQTKILWHLWFLNSDERFVALAPIVLSQGTLSMAEKNYIRIAWNLAREVITPIAPIVAALSSESPLYDPVLLLLSQSPVWLSKNGELWQRLIVKKPITKAQQVYFDHAQAFLNYTDGDLAKSFRRLRAYHSDSTAEDIFSRALGKDAAPVRATANVVWSQILSRLALKPENTDLVKDYKNIWLPPFANSDVLNNNPYEARLVYNALEYAFQKNDWSLYSIYEQKLASITTERADTTQKAAPQPTSDYFWGAPFPAIAVKDNILPLTYEQKRNRDWMDFFALQAKGDNALAARQLDSNLKSYARDLSFQLSILVAAGQTARVEPYYRQNAFKLNAGDKEEASWLVLQILLANHQTKDAETLLKQTAWSENRALSARLLRLNYEKNLTKAGQELNELKNNRKTMDFAELNWLGSALFLIGDSVEAEATFRMSEKLGTSNNEKNLAAYNAWLVSYGRIGMPEFQSRGLSLLQRDLDDELKYQIVVSLASAMRASGWLEAASNLYLNYFQLFTYNKLPIGLYGLATALEKPNWAEAYNWVQSIQPLLDKAGNNEKIDYFLLSKSVWLAFQKPDEAEKYFQTVLEPMGKEVSYKMNGVKAVLAELSLFADDKKIFFFRMSKLSEQSAAIDTTIDIGIEQQKARQDLIFLRAYAEYYRGNSTALKNYAQLPEAQQNEVQYAKLLKDIAKQSYDAKDYAAATNYEARSLFGWLHPVEATPSAAELKTLADYLKAAQYGKDSERLRKNTSANP